MNMFRNKDYTIPAFFALLIIVAIIKIPHLYVPHFWDEAWSYSPAVQYMSEHTLGLLPSVLPPEYSKGHPLLFFFLSASWMRIFGDSLAAKHCFALFISYLLLFSLFYTVSRLFSKRVAICSLMFVALQAVFLAQSSMLLPEIMLSFFTVWTLYFYLKRKPLPYLISGTLLLMTKESGVFLIIVIWVFDLVIFLLRNGNRSWGRQMLWPAILALPVFLDFVFLGIQKATYGWFFYPEHLSLIKTFSQGIGQLGSYILYFFILDGRIWLTSAFVVSLVIALLFRISMTGSEKRSILLMIVFIVFFIVAHSFFIFSPRYLLCANITMAVVSAFFIDLVTRRVPLLNLLVSVFIAGMLFNVSLHQRNNGDTDLGYIDSINLQKMAVSYFESNQLTKKRIYAMFVLRRDMQEKSAGYLSGEPFTRVTADPVDHPDYLVGSNIIYDPFFQDKRNYISFETVRHFQSGWMELTIYGKKQDRK
jgi:4-amino-4-deoxy-L-arabinose transferase-like glycosyltransferase